jgi:TRAP-type uncharacterized transport system fused permease subunit
MSSDLHTASTRAPIVRGLVFAASWLAVLSGLYHISAVYLRPLPGEMHPNMHLLLAYTILLIGGAGTMHEVYGEKIKKLNILPALYVLSLLPAVFFFYFVGEIGEGWSDQTVTWVYIAPFALWAAMMAMERAWLAILLWALGFVPFFFLVANWSALSESSQEPTLWWFLLASAIPVMWTLFGVFYRPVEGLRKAAVPLVVFFASLFLGAWRVGIWAGQPDEIRSVYYLWPVFILLIPLIWSRRKTREDFADYPTYPYPAGLTVGLNVGMLVYVVVACLYLFWFHEEMVDRPGAPTFADSRVGFIMIVVALELTRRCFGPPLPTLAIISISYGIWGNLFAAPFGHGGHDWVELLAKLSTDFIGGVLGFLVVISSTFIIMFLILGAFLHESGAGKFFVDFALGLFGRLRAGAGLAAVGASALMGTVSGSASGNVVTTGTFTIPLMKRIGLSPHIAGAAEAAASTGGQIMPPVMGAGAFIMSELIEVPYFQIIGYATIPAILYFTIVGINIHFAAGSLDIKPLPPEEIPDWRAELKSGWFYLVPLAFLVFFLFEGRTPVFAGVMAVFIMVGVWMYRNSTEFLGGFRSGDRTIPDDVFVFVPVTFWVFGFLMYVVLNGLEGWLGWPLSLRGAPAVASAVQAALVLGVVGVVLASVMVRFSAMGSLFWNEIQRGWMVIYPIAALGLWSGFGWTSGVAGGFIILVLLSVLSVARGYFSQPATVIPWCFVLIWAISYQLQIALYWIMPWISNLNEWFVPFGFIYHSLIFFGIAILIQKLILSMGDNGEGERPSVRQVAAISCNPFFYLRHVKSEGREEGADVKAAESAAKWLDRIRHALRVGGRQGAEFGVTLVTIDLVVTVLTITGIGNKFAYLIETLAKDVCFLGPAAGGGCAYYLGFDGFFMALILTAVACAILGMGMPTTAAYVLLAILGGPVLIKLVGPELAQIYGEEWAREFVAAKGDRVVSHMFIFYFAILSAITPPVAIASLVAAKLAGAPYFKTSMMSLRFAIVGFIVPFLFIFEPALLGFGHPGRVALSAGMTLLAFVAFSAGTQGWLITRLYFFERIILYVSFAAIILFIIFHSIAMLVIGLILGSVPLVRQLRDKKLASA